MATAVCISVRCCVRFNSRAPRGARRLLFSRSVQFAVSIHAPRVGRDRSGRRCGRHLNVSIHAPRVGRDRSMRRRVRLTLFQFTRPACATAVARRFHVTVNSRAPRGRSVDAICQRVLFLIHVRGGATRCARSRCFLPTFSFTPRWGATYPSLLLPAACLIHAPRGATRQRRDAAKISFNSRPAGARPRLHLQIDFWLNHAPAGATSGCCPSALRSFPAPAGARLEPIQTTRRNPCSSHGALRGRPDFSVFNLGQNNHAPAGATAAPARRYGGHELIHGPAWGATRLLRFQFGTKMFQFTRPAWGATPETPPTQAACSFNSRAPRGARRWVL